MNVHDEGFSKNVLCTLILTSMFLFQCVKLNFVVS